MSVQVFEGDGDDPEEFLRRSKFFRRPQDQHAIVKVFDPENGLAIGGDLDHKLRMMVLGQLDPKHLVPVFDELVVQRNARLGIGGSTVSKAIVLLNDAIRVVHYACQAYGFAKSSMLRADEL